MASRRRHDLRHAAMSVPGWVALILVLLLIAPTVLGNRAELLSVQEGRRLGATSSCSRDRAFIAAGRETILASALLPGDALDPEGGFIPGPLTQSLGAQYPAYATRMQLADAAADRYERRVLEAIRESLTEAGVAVNQIGKDGHLDCAVFREAIRAD